MYACFISRYVCDRIVARGSEKKKRKEKEACHPDMIKHRKDLASLFHNYTSIMYCRLHIILLIKEQLFAGDQRVSEREPTDASHVSWRRYPDRSIRRTCPGLQVQVWCSTSASWPSYRRATVWQSANHPSLPRVSRLARPENRSQGSQGVKLFF